MLRDAYQLATRKTPQNAMMMSVTESGVCRQPHGQQYALQANAMCVPLHAFVCM